MRLGSAAASLVLLVTLTAMDRRAQSETTPVPIVPQPSESIAIWADYSQEWEADGTTIWMLRGRCRIVQGSTSLTSQKMVVWKEPQKLRAGPTDRYTLFLEGDVRIERPGTTVSESSFLTELLTQSEASLDLRHRVIDRAGIEDPFFQRASARRERLERLPRQPKGRNLVQTQMIVPVTTRRRVRIFPRNFQLPFTFDGYESRQTTPPEQVIVLTRGINVLIDDPQRFGTLDLSADRMVIWTEPGIFGDSQDIQLETIQTGDTPLQIYLEGNIVVRQGNYVARADQAFYDVRENRGLMLGAELKTFIPELQTAIRIRADVLRQTSLNSFHAQRGWVTTSQLGKPGYRLQATDVIYEQRYPDPWLAPQADGIDPLTGVPLLEPVPWITSLNNTFLIDDLPLFYLPYLSGPGDDPNIPIRRASVRHDRIFGSQVRTTWNMIKLLGLDAQRGVTWDLDADYLSERGPGVGTSTDYNGFDLFGLGDHYSGSALGYYIHDDGHDNLGRDRRDLIPADENRYRVLARHRHTLPYDVTLTGEFAPISDRNFLEQYYENDFDEDKDQETLLTLMQQEDNWTWSILTRARLNDFENQTEWYPRGDINILGEPLFGGIATWSTHTSAGLANLKPARAPSDPADTFTPLPYYLDDLQGAVLMSRHELDVPLYLGPVIVVPYALGEAAYWTEGVTGGEVDRLYGRAGLRSSVMFWKLMPQVRSRIFNLNGLAHKMVFAADYSFSDATEDLDAIPQYNEFDDDAQERFRERYLMNTFGMTTFPAVYEPRFYAVRTGAGAFVTSPYHELVDDQQVLRLAWRQRLQTKVGPPHQLRIKNWMTLDLEVSYFPDSNRDNFGEDFGLLSSRYAWNVGDRTTLLANAFYDFFDDAQQLWDVGVLSQRSERGSVYVGVRQIKGADLDSQIITGSYSYAMGPKWISTFGTAYDLAEGQNRGQSLTITRVGADFLIHFGASYDASKDNAGIALAIEPRFGPLNGSPTNLSSLLGIR